MQIALNMLLARAKPHRLLIEPTGLGHPKEVLQTLSAEHYREVLDIRATLTLIDVRKLANKRWREHHTFQEQLQVADHIVATKFDLYDDTLMPTLYDYLDELGIENPNISCAQNGKVSLDILHSQSNFQQKTDAHIHSHAHSPFSSTGSRSKQPHTISTPNVGSVKVANSGEGYYSYGWICAPTEIFNYKQVMQTLSPLSVERLKAVLITEQGVVGCNLSDGCLSLNITGLEEAADSRIEFLTQDKSLAEQTCKELEAAFGLVSDSQLA
jgi:G3E family GTPase